MNMYDLHTQVAMIFAQVRDGGTIYAVCPSRVRGTLSIVMLSRMGKEDNVSGTIFNIGQGQVVVVAPGEEPPAGLALASLLSPSEADTLEYKGMTKWRQAAKTMIA